MDTISQIQIQSDNGKTTKSSFVVTPVCKIKTIGNQLMPKLDDVIRLYVENVRGLPTSKSVCNSDKVDGLRHSWSKLNACFMTLLETHINPSLLTNKDSLHVIFFRINQLHKHSALIRKTLL